MGRIDVHSHLLPGVDDGCATIEASLACARRLVEAGYTESFCTPHIWPSFPNNTVPRIVDATRELGLRLGEAGIPLRLMPGGEINLRAEYVGTPAAEVPTFGMKGKYALVDLWVDKLPHWVEGAIRWFGSMGMTVIWAHPERMRAVQDEPGVADLLAGWGVLLQGNLQCLSDPPESATRRMVEKFLTEEKYVLLGSDLHNPETLEMRMKGLEQAARLVGSPTVDRLTIENPRKLMSGEL